MEITKPSTQARSSSQSCLFTVDQLGRYDGPPRPRSLTELCGCAFPSGGFGGVISNLEGTVSCVCKVRTSRSLPHGTARQFPVPATFQILREYFLPTASLSPAVPCFRSPSVFQTSHAHPSIETRASFRRPSLPFPPFSSPLPTLASVDEHRGVRGRSQVAPSVQPFDGGYSPCFCPSRPDPYLESCFNIKKHCQLIIA